MQALWCCAMSCGVHASSICTGLVHPQHYSAFASPQTCKCLGVKLTTPVFNWSPSWPRASRHLASTLGTFPAPPPRSSPAPAPGLVPVAIVQLGVTMNCSGSQQLSFTCACTHSREERGGQSDSHGNVCDREWRRRSMHERSSMPSPCKKKSFSK